MCSHHRTLISGFKRGTHNWHSSGYSSSYSLSGHRDMIGTPLRPVMAGIQSTPDRITIVSPNRGRKMLIEKEREEVGRASDGFATMEKLFRSAI
jgi:hypothetical protein